MKTIRREPVGMCEARANSAENRRTRRNLNPHKAAVAAMYLWGRAYSRQGGSGGSMDFWDDLSPASRDLCRRMVADIEKARPE